MSADTPDIEDLQKRIDRIEQKLAALEDDGAADDGRGDWRKQAVLDALEPGEIVTRRQFTQLWRTQTDVQNAGTIKTRTKALTTSPLFESAGHGKWRYIGGADDE